MTMIATLQAHAARLDPMNSDVSNFWDLATRRPEAIALVDEDQESWTAARLLEECNRIANGLRDLGLRQGDVVALLLPSCGQLLATVLATYQVGMYALLLNPRFSQEELLYLLNDAEARVLIIHPALAAPDKLARVLADPRRIHIGLGALAGCRSYEDVFGNASAASPAARTGGAILSYTSGTTGRPKGVLRPVGNCSPEAVLAPLVRWYKESFGIVAGEAAVQLSCCPQYFSGPVIHSLYALHLGHKLILLKYWNARVALELIQRYSVTTAFMVPFHFQSLLRLPAPVRLRYDTRTLRRVFHGGAPCPVDTKRAMLDWLGPCIHESYGATEVGATQASPEDWVRYPGTVGRATHPHEVRILDAAGNAVPAGTIGRVFLHEPGFNRFIYKGDPQKTAACRVGDFVTVGDIGYMNGDGYLFLCDRREDLILCRGENVYPAEVEAALASHNRVLDCACYGLPHADWGQQVALAVQWDRSIEPDTDRTESLLRHLMSRLSPAKIPSVIRFVDQIPRDASGKLRRAELRAGH
jgi:long-chain acyl-CoA synthetase